ncbi:hypothetical protein [Agrococcus pavilionensis]|nr:hypothetical protein [Agrococcus pavilionensis]
MAAVEVVGDPVDLVERRGRAVGLTDRHRPVEPHDGDGSSATSRS